MSRAHCSMQQAEDKGRLNLGPRLSLLGSSSRRTYYAYYPLPRREAVTINTVTGLFWVL